MFPSNIRSVASRRIIVGVGIAGFCSYCLFVACAYRTTPDSTTWPASSSAASTEADEFPLNAILTALREQWAFRDSVDWAEVEPEVRARVARANSDSDRAKVIVDVFARVDDVHSILTVRGESHAHYIGIDEATRRRLLPLLDRERAQAGKVVVKILDDRVGYVLVPTMPANTPEEVERLARQLHDRISEAARQQLTGWIVDLRLNGGGNLYPMLTGLRPLLGDGVVGGTIDPGGQRVQEWVLKPDGLYWRDTMGDRRFVELDMSAEVPDPLIPVVVLVGPLTRSSGQGAALAFQGRRRCLLLGEPTAKGYTTVTTPFALTSDVSLSLAVGFMADRSGIPCKSQVVPDLRLEGGDAFESLMEDEKVRAAIERLQMAE